MSVASSTEPSVSLPAEQRPLLTDITGHGDPIVLVPGGLSGWLSWIPHAKRLAESRTAVRVQLRSVELAEAGVPVPPTYGPLTERDALRATVDDLGLERFDLAGWSHGGHVALAFALEYPERVRTLTLIEPAAMWILKETGWDHDTLAAEAIHRARAGRDITIDDLTHFLSQAGFGQPGDDFTSLPSWPIWVRNRQVLSTIHTIWAYTDSLARLRRLTTPLLAVKGSDSSADNIAIVDALAATAPHATLLELPGDHACHIQQIDRFLAALESHLAQG